MPHCNNKPQEDHESIQYKNQFIARNARALTLRELYCRQIGNYFGAYKKLMFGSSGEPERYTYAYNKNGGRCSGSCKHHLKHMDRNVATDQVNFSKQSSVRKVASLPATHCTPAFVVKEDTQQDNTIRQNRVSYDSMLSDKEGVERSHSFKENQNKPPNEKLRHSSSRNSRRIGSRLSLIFGMEDMITDSTSILKDSRHPSISAISGTQPIFEKNKGIV